MCTDHARKLCVCSLGSNSAHGESKLSARGVQTQHAVPPPAVHCPPTPNATCLTQSPHHCAALAPFALAGRWSPSPHACLARSPHHHAALVAFALARRWSSSPHACLARSPHHHATHAALAGRPHPMPHHHATHTALTGHPLPTPASPAHLPSPCRLAALTHAT